MARVDRVEILKKIGKDWPIFRIESRMFSTEISGKNEPWKRLPKRKTLSDFKKRKVPNVPGLTKNK